MRWIGIDPGNKGGIAILEQDDSVEVYPMPITGTGKDKLIDGATVAEIIGGRDGLVVIEKVHAMPKQGVSSTFAFGRGFGQLIGVLQVMGLQWAMVTPQAWKKAILAGCGDKGKKATIAWCKRMFPDVSLIPERCRTEHDGMADALAMAEYGRRMR